MTPNAFVGRPSPPGETDLAEALGSAKNPWDALLARLQAEYDLEPEWKSYSIKAGWSLRLKQKKRNIIYLSPFQGAFEVTFILGDRAVQAAIRSPLPQRLVQLVENGTRYPEGTGVRIGKIRAGDILGIVKLAGIKIQN